MPTSPLTVTARTGAARARSTLAFRKISSIGDIWMIKKSAEERAAAFYDTVGWETEGEITEDARRWEDLREYSREYVSRCRLRVLRHIPESGENMLDMASGPIQYKEYLEYSRNFKKRYCVDLSSIALASAKKKIGDHGVFLHGSFFDIPLEENFFDCSISLHTIYHIDKDKQEEAVRKLIKVTKQAKPVIIVYSSPNRIISFFKSPYLLRVFKRLRSFLKNPNPLRVLKKARRVLKNPNKTIEKEQGGGLYFHSYPIEWWNRFSDVAHVQVLPWRSFSSDIQKRFMPNNKIGGRMFNILFNLEERFPGFFVKHFQYPMIILTKRKS